MIKLDKSMNGKGGKRRYDAKRKQRKVQVRPVGISQKPQWLGKPEHEKPKTETTSTVLPANTVGNETICKESRPTKKECGANADRTKAKESFCFFQLYKLMFVGVGIFLVLLLTVPLLLKITENFYAESTKPVQGVIVEMQYQKPKVVIQENLLFSSVAGVLIPHNIRRKVLYPEAYLITIEAEVNKQMCKATYEVEPEVYANLKIGDTFIAEEKSRGPLRNFLADTMLKQ